MQIITFLVVCGVVFKMLLDYEPMNKRIERMDNDPNNTVKSDKWIKEHPEEWEKMKKERY